VLLGAVLLGFGLSRAALGGQAASPTAEAPTFLLEDFETATLGARPYLWKEGRQNAADATIGVERSAVAGNEANKALQFEYQFPPAFDPAQGVEAGPLGQALPSGLTGISLQLHGDAGKHAVVLRLHDQQGEAFEWETLVTWKGWRKITVALDAAAARVVGRRVNGTLDYPLTFQAIRLSRRQGGAARGTVQVDSLTAECRFGSVKALYDPAVAVQPEQWRAVRNRATLGAVSASRASSAGRNQPALKLEYEYENGVDASVEFTRVISAGTGPGTLTAEVFGDGSNNLLRFRLRDGAGKVWTATWAQKLIDWSGWKTVYLDTRTLRDPTGRDLAAAPDKFPISFQALVVDDCSPNDLLPGVESGRKGEIYLGRLSFYLER
jgi:hypothetical protein